MYYSYIKIQNLTLCSHEELAKKAEITYSTLIKNESGANDNPTIKILIKLANALELSLDQLVERENL